MMSPDHQDFIDEQAAQWVARLGGEPLSTTEQSQLDQWLKQSHAHSAAFAEAQTAWMLMARVQLPRDVRSTNISYLKSSTTSQKPAPPKMTKRHRVWWRGVGAVAAGLMLTIGAVDLSSGVFAARMADYRTAAGSQQRLTLPDGSVVELGPASALNLQYSDHERSIRLVSGLAYFTVVPMEREEQRPFIVEASGTRVRALGTEFMVQHLANSVEVIVTEHTVEVTAEESHKGQSKIITEGQQVRYGAGVLGSAEPVEFELATAWRHGRLVFNQMPLGDVVAILNRYRSNQLLVTDALAARTVSGVFNVADTDAILDTFVHELDITSTRLPFFTFLH